MKHTRYYFQLKKGYRKIFFYISNFSTYLLPGCVYRCRLKTLWGTLSEEDKREIETRTAYYNRMPIHSHPGASWTKVSDFTYPFGAKQKFATYFFDLYQCVRYFNPHFRFAFKFGDITETPGQPTFVKSRPITQGISNAVLLKLNRIRHFVFINDSKSFKDKRDMLISRNIVRQPHRRRLLERYYGHPMCDIGQINMDTNQDHPEWIKEYKTVPEQLDYKFICCIEGNDVATNLKWVMSSNSLAVMPRPKYETWFMEGTLIPNYHYVEIAEDYSDLIEKMNYYINHPEAAEAIIEHAHKYISRFRNTRMEKLVSLSVVQSYFQRTGQINNIT